MIRIISIGSFQVTLWAVFAAVFVLAAAAWTVFSLRRQGWTALQAVFCCVLAAAVSLLIGRALFFALRPELLTDPMGDSLGLAPLFDPSAGSAAAAGVLAGLLAGIAAAAACLKKDPAAALDTFTVPGLFLFAAFRFIEPLTGQGFGPFLANPALCFVPLGIRNGWGDWMLSVCFIEGLLLFAAAAAVCLLRFRTGGSKTLCALILLSLLQIIPESLRCDDVLKIFIFARVTQLAYAAVAAVCAAAGWRRSARLGAGKAEIIREAALFFTGILLLIAGEFALDKTQWPDWAIYLGMGLVLAGMLWMLLRRLIRNDRIGAPKRDL